MMIFWRYPNFLKSSVGQVIGSVHAQTHIDSSSRFYTIPACDERIDGQTHDDRIHRASIASRGKNVDCVIVRISYW